MPAPDEVLPFEHKDSPIVYRSKEGQHATDDVVAKLLVRRYGASPEAAAALADKIRGTDDDLVKEAMNEVAEREKRRMALMSRYTDTVLALQRGDQVSTEDAKFVERWDTRMKQLTRERAEKTLFDQQARADTAKFQQQRDAQAAHAGFQGLNSAATAMTQLPGAIGNGLAAAMPQPAPAGSQVAVGPDFMRSDRRGGRAQAVLDPMSASLVSRMFGGQ